VSDCPERVGVIEGDSRTGSFQERGIRGWRREGIGEAWSANLYVSRRALADKSDRSLSVVGKNGDYFPAEGEHKDNYSAGAIVSVIQSCRFRAGARNKAGRTNPIAAEYFDCFIKSDKRTAAERPGLSAARIPRLSSSEATRPISERTEQTAA